MKIQISKILIALLIATLSTAYANNHSNQAISKAKHYTQMSTVELQIEVERLSNKGILPFEMGLELLKRWAESKKEVKSL
ncbi:MAG: Unknown protein [uncultured Sulfurovum sp.]|uniref:Uncharacterized protein n=1 Tax=uncultured Sulfurovum sp. TaxID=269237 RepID=A0A6S6SNN7_9BACT|nr:MAG: Unknown protein [uncultured Sulfurovum sp.]